MMKMLLPLLLLPAIGSTKTAMHATLCELVRNPEKFNGERVRVSATHRLGFEISEPYCLGCIDSGLVFLDLPADIANRDAKRLTGHHSLTTNVVVEGRFVYEGGPFGHNGAYKYKIVAESF